MLRIVLYCATQRGVSFLKRIVELSPDSEIYVFSFREEMYEPLFFDDIRKLTISIGGKFYEVSQQYVNSVNSFGRR